MAESFVGNVIEFLIGFIVLPRLVLLVWVFTVPYLGLGGQTAILTNLVLSAILIAVTFFIRKMLAIGFLAGSVWGFVISYLALFG